MVRWSWWAFESRNTPLLLYLCFRRKEKVCQVSASGCLASLEIMLMREGMRFKKQKGKKGISYIDCPSPTPQVLTHNSFVWCGYLVSESTTVYLCMVIINAWTCILRRRCSKEAQSVSLFFAYHRLLKIDGVIEMLNQPITTILLLAIANQVVYATFENYEPPQLILRKSSLGYSCFCFSPQRCMIVLLTVINPIQTVVPFQSNTFLLLLSEPTTGLPVLNLMPVHLIES